MLAAALAAEVYDHKQPRSEPADDLMKTPDGEEKVKTTCLHTRGETIKV